MSGSRSSSLCYSKAQILARLFATGWALSLQRYYIWLLGASVFWWQKAASQSKGLFRREVRLNSSAISSGCRKKCSWVILDSTRVGKNIMIAQTTSQNAHKKGLQRQIKQTRDSLR